MPHQARMLVLVVLLSPFLLPARSGASAQAGGQRGALLWEDRFDLSAFEQAFSSAAGGNRLFVAGFVSTAPPSRDFVVRAYSVDTGDLLWHNRVDRGGDEYALAVATDGDTVWVSGNTGQNGDWLVRAYEAPTGLLLWEDIFDRAGGFDGVQNRALLFDNGILHVGGTGTVPPTLRVDAPSVSPRMRGPIVWQPWAGPMTPAVSGGLVEAAIVAQPEGDVRGDLGCRIGNDAGPNPFPPGSLTGAVVVVDRGICAVHQKAANAAEAGAVAVIFVMLPGQQPFAFPGQSVDIPTVAIARERMTDLREFVAAGTQVVVTLSDEFAGAVEGIVRSYDGATGALVWQDRFDRGERFQQARAFATTANRVFMTGTSTSPIADEVVVRAYDSSTGALQWEHYTPGIKSSHPSGGFTFGRGIVAQGNRVFVGSSIETTTGVMAVIQAYDAGTGALLWEDRPQDNGNVNFLEDIAVAGAEVVALGFGGVGCSDGPSPPANCNVTVRSYHSTTGALRWAREFDLSGIHDQGADVEIAHGTVYLSAIAGYLSDDGGGWRIRALDSATGDTRWESAGGDVELPQDLTLYKNRLFVPGRSVNPETGHWDFIVRTLDARPGG